MTIYYIQSNNFYKLDCARINKGEVRKVLNKLGGAKKAFQLNLDGILEILGKNFWGKREYTAVVSFFRKMELKVYRHPLTLPQLVPYKSEDGKGFTMVCIDCVECPHKCKCRCNRVLLSSAAAVIYSILRRNQKK
jgi:hypothetical protein